MISTAQLAQFCRRAATSLHAGLDVRQVFTREATIGPMSKRAHMAGIVERIDNGQAVADAMTAERGYFPSLAVEMVRVGEQTGKLERVLAQLADYYEHMLRLRRTFMLGMIWPALQLAFALAVVGFLIWIMGVISPVNLQGEPVDYLGFGLRGTSGLVTYVGMLVVVMALIGGLVYAVSRGWLWHDGLMPVLMKVPLVGNCLRSFALSRFSWTLAMAIDAGMEATRSLRLALSAVQNSYYSSLGPQIERTMERRCPMSEALRQTGRFPSELLIVLETGELSGMITETLERQSAEYLQRAQAQLRLLTMAAGFALAALVAGMLVFLIFRLFFAAYLGPINELLRELKQGSF